MLTPGRLICGLGICAQTPRLVYIRNVELIASITSGEDVPSQILEKKGKERKRKNLKDWGIISAPNFRPWTLTCNDLEYSLRCKKRQSELTEFKWHFEECLQEIYLTDFWLNVHKKFTCLTKT